MTAPETGRFSFSDLPGWADDDLDEALAAFRLNPDGPLSDAAARAVSGRSFFEMYFAPTEALEGHFTGYYEPQIAASLVQTEEFKTPLHANPPGSVTAARSEIEGCLAGYEIAWVRDEVDRFFLQVQGSGRLRLPDWTFVRVGYAGSNGQPYRSIGKQLVETGVFGPDITAETLKAWLREDPDRGRAIMGENPSYVFFKVVETPPDVGPKGTLCPVTAMRSIAVDPDHTPLGTPVWINVDGLARLTIAQDTGSAIKGAGRADLYFGSGDVAGKGAGQLNHRGQYIPLVPR